MANKKIDLNQVPVDWITIDSEGNIIIKNEKFSAEVKDAIESEGLAHIARNGGCNCPTT